VFLYEIPKHKAVIVRMTNSLWTFGGKNGFNYISDIQRFGNLIYRALSQHSKIQYREKRLENILRVDSIL
jgi:hypothetical protein